MNGACGDQGGRAELAGCVTPQATGPLWALVNFTIKCGQATRVGGLLFLWEVPDAEQPGPVFVLWL